MSWTRQAFGLFKKMPRPLSSRDLVLHLDMPSTLASQTMKQLESMGVIEVTSGNVRTGRYYQLKPGATELPERRGRKRKQPDTNLHAVASRAHGPKTGRL